MISVKDNEFQKGDFMLWQMMVRNPTDNPIVKGTTMKVKARIFLVLKQRIVGRLFQDTSSFFLKLAQ